MKQDPARLSFAAVNLCGQVPKDFASGRGGDSLALCDEQRLSGIFATWCRKFPTAARWEDRRPIKTCLA